MAPIGRAVFATLLMNDAYLPGAMVLGHSLRDRGVKAPLVAFITVDRLASDTINELRTVYDEVVPIQQITNKNPANLYLMNRPDLISTFTKVELWRQTQYTRIIYMDADTVALRAPNELLTVDADFAAVPDIGWPDCFNTGLMVLKPNMADYYALLALAQRGISFDGADQGLLNMHFRDWKRLSFVYNCTPSGNYQYVPAYRHFQSSIAVVHFIGQDKPWTLGRDNRYNTGVYGELLGMWWSVYDRHYRPMTVTHYDTQTYTSTKKVQDYVRGEEPLYVPSYSSQQQQVPSPQQGQIPLPPEITIPGSNSHQTVKVEMPLGDAPTPAMRSDFAPIATAEQRRFSAPHVEWEPSRAPPPAHSKPEAANFPTTIYDMSSDTQLFQPPTRYPEAPKDMWYQVPEKTPEPIKPRQIFPWEARAPKPTRVFPQARPPSPPPPQPAEQTTLGVQPKESSAEVTDQSKGTEESPPTPTQREPINPWEAFQQRTNAWDDMPEIERYMRALSQAKKGKLQVLHHTPTQRSPGGTAIASPTTADSQRRPSLKLTDFPTEIERPSLPVTPAPIRRATIWGQERDEETLPTAEGVPKQEDWVRRFSSYPTPDFAAALRSTLVHDLPHVFYWRCQYCGKQNPVSKLEELQRRQSEVLMSPNVAKEVEEADELPQREMPESNSKEAVIHKTELAISPTKTPKVPKPILKAPHFELGQEPDEPASDVKRETDEKEDMPSPTSARPLPQTAVV